MEGTTKISHYLKKDLLFVQSEFSTKEALFKAVNQEAEQLGYVTAHFLTKLEDRERQFPTGIPLEQIGAAIPHTDADCITTEFIAVVTTKEPVVFKSMEDGQSDVPASIIFVLGLNQPHAQLEMLQSLMGVLQNQQLLDQLLKASDKETFFKIITENNL